MSNDKLICRNSCEGYASLFVIFAIFLLLGMQTELAYRYMTRSETIKVFRQRFREEEELHIKAANSSSLPTDKIIVLSKNTSSLYFHRPDGNFAIPAPLFVRDKNQPLILWRKFLLGDTRPGTCDKVTSQCRLEYAGLVRTYGDINVNDLELISEENIYGNGYAREYKSMAALGTPGSTYIRGSLSLKSKKADLSLFIIAAFKDIEISTIQKPENNSVIVFYSASGTVKLPHSLPDHANCLQNKTLGTDDQKKDARENLPVILISASKAYSGDLELDMKQYQLCIKNSLRAWFPEEKLVGFSRR